MTLIDLQVEDTGYYKCEGPKGPFGQKKTRFVYVSSGLFFIGVY
jgi:hypothetical protein